MSSIDSVSSVNAVVAAHREAQQAMRKQRAQKKEQQELEALVAEQNIEDGTNDVISEPAQNFNNEVSTIAKQFMQGNLTGTAPQFSQQMLNEFVARYAEEMDIEALLKFFGDDKISSKSLDELCEEMEAKENGENILAKFFQTRSLSNGQIYIILSYLLEYFKLRKSKYQALAARLLEQLEEQDSAYLFEFFQITKANSTQQMSFTNLDALAKSASGNVNSSSLTDIIKFIHDAFDDDYSQLVSNCVKYRLKILNNAQQRIMSFEDKANLGDYLLFEKHLIVIHSTYIKLRHLLTSIREQNPKSKENYSQMLTATINFAQANFISDLTFNNMMRSMAIITDKLTHSVVLKIIVLFRSLPIEIFNQDGKQQQKVVDGLTQQAEKRANNDENQENQFGFLKPLKKSIILRG